MKNLKKLIATKEPTYLLTTTEVAYLLGVIDRRVRQMCVQQTNHFPNKQRHGGRWLIPLGDVMQAWQRMTTGKPAQNRRLAR